MLMRSCPFKKARVKRLLSSKAWRERSTNWIASVAKVSWGFADKIRQLLGGRPVRVKTRNGRLVAANRRRK